MVERAVSLYSRPRITDKLSNPLDTPSRTPGDAMTDTSTETVAYILAGTGPITLPRSAIAKLLAERDAAIAALDRAKAEGMREAARLIPPAVSGAASIILAAADKLEGKP